MRTGRPAIVLLTPAWIVLFACAGGRTTTGGPLPSVENAEVRRHIEFLASDALAGRQTPSRGLELAAEYVRGELARAGLAPGIRGEYVQRFPFPLAAPDTTRTQLVVRGRTLAYGNDYTVMAGGPAGGVMGETRFVGRAPEVLTSRRLDSLRFSGIVVAYLPGYPSDRSRDLAGRLRADVARIGARGVLFLVDSTIPGAEMRRAGLLSLTPAREQAEVEDGIPGAFVREPAAVSALSGPGGTNVRVVAPRRIVAADSAPNVVAILRGSDPTLREQYVMVSAHLDHIGVASTPSAGDSIFNGADDNASGTAALLAIASKLAREPTSRRPRRSILFVSVSGEEHGLLGSAWLAAHSPVQTSRIVADINLDMVGRNSRDTVYAIGMEYSTLGSLVMAIAAERRETQLHVQADPQPEEGSFLRSDQFSFARYRIPGLLLTSGFHADYHAVTDDPSRLDVEKVARVARLAEALVRRVADADERPAWTTAGEALLSRIQVGAIKP